MTEQITIQGYEFTVPSPYTEGHVLTANEAAALNGLLHENLRNNFSTKVKKAIEAAGEGGTPDLAKLQGELTEYADAYEFSGRARGGASVKRDPVEREAIRLATAAIRSALKAKGKNLKDYTAEQLEEAAVKLLEDETKGAPFKQAAAERVKAAQSAAAITVDLGV